ncbi:MAG: hypothetical protein IJ438_13175 [Clostridia bacterium]|nr:hypothetical protein [Clostridia bacterium]
MLPETIKQARDMLRDVTPLRTDCGMTCGGACCMSLPGEMTGMLLFPGEEAYYVGREGYAMTDTGHGMLLTCDGQCSREDRPLSCRLFPLLPLLRADGVKVATDLRARAVCPLAKQGKDALLPEFVAAVRRAGQLLVQDEAQAAFLLRLTRNQDELKALRKQFRRDAHV